MRVRFEGSRICKAISHISRRYIYQIQLQSRGRVKFLYNTYQPDHVHRENACRKTKSVKGFDRTECKCKLESCPRAHFVFAVHVYDYIKSTATLKFNLERECEEITIYANYDVNDVNPVMNPLRVVLKSFGYSEFDIAKWLMGVNFSMTFDRKLTYLKIEYFFHRERNVVCRICQETGELKFES